MNNINPFLWNFHTAIIEKTIKPGSPEDKRFLALALCGEVGELANLIKKEWRGDSDPEFSRKVADELGDIYAYLRLIALAYNLDLDEVIENITIPKIKARWGKPNFFPSFWKGPGYDCPSTGKKCEFGCTVTCSKW